MAAVQQLLRTNPYWANYMASSSLMQPRLGNFQGTNPFPLGFHPGVPGVLSLNSIQNIAATTPNSTSSSSSSSSSSSTSSSVTSATLPTTVSANSLTLPVYPFHLPPTSFSLNFTAGNLNSEQNNAVLTSDEKSESK